MPPGSSSRSPGTIASRSCSCSTSSARRDAKNAAGLIEAFARAFAPGEGPRLLLKTINGRLRPRPRPSSGAKIAERPDIELIDTYLDPAQNAALLARADCYVSLHRSEGFGLTLAESMALGTPVIATGYSGNTGLHHAAEQLPGRVDAYSGRTRLRDLSGGRDLGRTGSRSRRRR